MVHVKHGVRQYSLHIRTLWLSPVGPPTTTSTTTTPDSLFQWNKRIDADGSGLLWRSRLEILANCWQKQLRMCLGTNFPVYWTLLSCAAIHHFQRDHLKIIFTSTLPSVSKMLVFSQNVYTCVSPSLVLPHACSLNISSTHTFAFSPGQTGSNSYSTSRVSSNTRPDWALRGT